MDHPRLSMVLAHFYDPSLELYKIEVRPDGLIHVDDPAGLAGDVELVKRVAFAVHDDPSGAYGKLAASDEVGSEELEEFAGMFLTRA